MKKTHLFKVPALLCLFAVLFSALCSCTVSGVWEERSHVELPVPSVPPPSASKAPVSPTEPAGSEVGPLFPSPRTSRQQSLPSP